MSARKRIQGFTLVEILIVVVILGILAAIVIPQFSTASDAARASSTLSQLQTIRSQLELYRVQHGATYPTIASLQLNAGWEPLLQASDAVGNLKGDNIPTPAFPYGAYLQKAPVNPFTASSTVAAAAAAGVGWVYNEATGEIEMCIPATVNIAALGLDPVDYESF